MVHKAEALRLRGLIKGDSTLIDVGIIHGNLDRMNRLQGSIQKFIFEGSLLPNGSLL